MSLLSQAGRSRCGLALTLLTVAQQPVSHVCHHAHSLCLRQDPPRRTSSREVQQATMSGSCKVDRLELCLSNTQRGLPS